MIPCAASIAWLALQEVRVVDSDRKPVPNATVLVAAGLARLDLTADHQPWEAVRRLELATDEHGLCHVPDLPMDAHVTVLARSEKSAGTAEGAPNQTIEVVLQPTGTLTGKVSNRKGLQGYSVHAIGPRGFETWTLELGADEWVLPGIAAGEVELQLRLGNWVALRKLVEVKPGKPTKVPALKVGEQFLLHSDPLVDVRRVRLVDAGKEPLPGLKLVWSSPMMDGAMPSDEAGEVLLEGGGVAIGSAPFVLRLAMLGFDQEQKYLGRLLGIERGTAVVQVAAPLEPWSVTVRRAGTPVGAFQLFAVTGGNEPRVWSAKYEGASARLELPPGRVRLVVGTIDGKVHEEELDRPAGEPEYVVQIPDG